MAKKWNNARSGIGTSWRSTALTLVAFIALLIAGAALAGESPSSLISTVTSGTTGASTDAGSSASTETTAKTGAVAATASEEASTPTISTDQSEYVVGATVTLSGEGWAPSEAIHIFVNDDVNAAWSYSTDTTASANGTFSIQFQLPDTFIATYRATATGPISGSATTTFADPLVVDFKQCSNGTGTTHQCTPAIGAWIGSIVQSSNSRYAEGMSLPERTVFTSIDSTSGDNHTLTFDHDATKGGIHAFDFLTSYEQAIRAASDLGIPYNPATLMPYTPVAGQEPATINRTFTNAEACGDNIGPPGTLGATCVSVRNIGGLNVFNVPIPDDLFISKDGPVQQRIDAYEATYGNRYLRIYGSAPITNAITRPDVIARREPVATPATRRSSTSSIGHRPRRRS